MVSVSSHLLSIFAQNLRFGTDIHSCSRRYKILSLIYLNIILFVIQLSYESLTWLFLGNQNVAFTVTTLIFTPLCFWLIKKGKDEQAAASLMLEIHVLNFCANYVTDQPMVSLVALTIFPNAIFMLSDSLIFRVSNILLCLCQYIFHVSAILGKFRVTLNDEQRFHILTGVFTSLLVLIIIFGQCLIQQSIETNLWEVAQKNYQKSEDLTREAIQAVEAKDMFISSLSHEIRNPLNSMTGSIDYLLSLTKDTGMLKILKNAKLSSEILLNLINNLLDAAKLKSDKMDVAAVETNFDDIIQKLFTINSENFISKDIFAQAFIDKRLPKVLWIDPSRLLQITMNLLSNALKFTKQGGKIHIYVTWCSTNQTREELLSPTENFTPSLENTENSKLNKSSHVLPSQLNIHSPKRKHTETSLLEEFTKPEIRERIHNFKALRSFKVHNLISLNNTSSEKNFDTDPDPVPESWIIRRTRMLSGSPKSFPSSTQESSQATKKGFLKVEVLDTGCGIAESDLPKLFGMFNQAQNRTLTTGHGGTGLGLWICKQICEKLGGDITVYSQLNQGTRFVFYVPINNQPLTDLNIQARSTRKGQLRALVVDDYSFNRDLHKLLLQQEGVHVILAKDGKEALDKYKAQANDYFDFIMMDVQMPVMDGFTAAKEIRLWETKNGRTNVDIYFVSGEYFNEDDVLAGFKTQEKGMEAIGLRYFRKPVEVKMLRNMVLKYKNRVGESTLQRSSTRQTIEEVETIDSRH